MDMNNVINESPLETVQRVGKYPTLKTLAQMSESTGLSEERLRGFADANLCPHWRVDGGKPMFQLAEMKRWIIDNGLLQYQEGHQITNIEIIKTFDTISNDRPKELALVASLQELPVVHQTAGVYFLCDELKILYVGQSVHPYSRVSQHAADGKIFNRVFLIPCPKDELNYIEGKFIRELEPPLNGRTTKGEMIAPCANHNDIIERRLMKS